MGMAPRTIAHHLHTLTSVMVFLVAAGLASAQEPGPVAPLTTAPQLPEVAAMNPASCVQRPRVWLSGEYLLWWLKDGPLPVPLVTTGNPANPLAGLLDQPDTVVLFGGSDLRYGTFSGTRWTLGFHPESGVDAIEVSAFLLECRGVAFAAASNGAGVPALTLPFFDLSIGAANGIGVASATGLLTAGGVSVTSFTRTWGAEANALWNVTENGNLRLDALAGFRHLSLNEEIDIAAVSRDLTTGVLDQLDEGFATRNRFYGGQVGARLAWQRERVSLQTQAQVALGCTYEMVDVHGALAEAGAGAAAPGTNPGGVYTQSTNLGRSHRGEFGVIPAVQIKLAVALSTNWVAMVGYDCLWWDSVVRPGEQIDGVVNPSQSRVYGGGTLVGAPAPLRRFEESSFFAHGMSFGLEYRW